MSTLVWCLDGDHNDCPTVVTVTRGSRHANLTTDPSRPICCDCDCHVPDNQPVRGIETVPLPPYEPPPLQPTRETARESADYPQAGPTPRLT
jgi:hypothetical protein